MNRTNAKYSKEETPLNESSIQSRTATTFTTVLIILSISGTVSGNILPLQISPPVAEQVIRSLAIGAYVASNADVAMPVVATGVRASFYFVSVGGSSPGNTGPVFQDEASSTLSSANLTVQQLQDVATAIDTFACGDLGSYCDRLLDTTEQGFTGIIWRIAFRLGDTTTAELEQELLQTLDLTCAVPTIAGCEFDRHTFVVPDQPYGNPPLREIPIKPLHARFIIQAMEYMCVTFAVDCFREGGHGTNGQYGVQFTLFRNPPPSVVFIYDARHLTLQRLESGTLNNFFSHCFSAECMRFRTVFEDARNMARLANEGERIGEHILNHLHSTICNDIPDLSGVCDGSYGPGATPCHLINAGDSLPEGFGAPYNVLSIAQEQLIQVSCVGIQGRITLGNGSPQQIIGYEGYYWRNGEPRIALIICNGESNDIGCIGSARYILPTEDITSVNAVVFRICTQVGDELKCACRDSACESEAQGIMWNVQTFQDMQ